jgi:3-keto-disaccharide hydrolase
MSLLRGVALLRLIVLAFTIALCVVSISWNSARAQTSGAIAPTPTTPHPTAPPPGSPAPGSRCLGCGTAPEPIDYTDRTGWTQIFDGKTLNNWDGNPEVWKVEDGAITAANWPERRVGTTYIIWRGGEPGDFELKLEVKADYDVHGGIFYRSAIGTEPARAGGGGSGARGAPSAGTPRSQPAPPAVPSDPRWNMRGYAMDWDYDPGNNGNIQDPGAGRTDTQIVWRGHIVRTENGKRPRSIGTLGDRDALMKFINLGDWNHVHIVAHGHQLTHIVNGHVMAILIDDDQAAVKTKGHVALQIEQYGAGKISFRNVWLKQ